MTIGTCVISHGRLPLLQMTIETMIETVTGPWLLMIVDNGSDEETVEWICSSGYPRLLLGDNLYPGAATNRGWRALHHSGVDLLHRSDNDMRYLPGWADTLRETFAEHPDWGQVGLRTDDEEMHVDAVGGNNAIRTTVWTAGVRYTSRPWTEIAWEDGHFNRRVQKAGFGWGRVPRPCVVHEGRQDPNDPYYQRTYRERNIEDLLHEG